MSHGAGWDPRLTEARNPRTEEIDCADPDRIVAIIQAEDRAVGPAVESQAAAIARAVAVAADALRRGGRLIYVGAGTSGRLGVLDAAECPPTFGTEPERIRGVIAGGEAALVRSSEGAEDDGEEGAVAVDELEIGPRDFVLGIATSGTTPYVRGALERARERGARIGFISCTDPPPAVRALEPLLITPLVGPEVIAGSTRLKAGTATKLVLNTISTGAMICTGRIYRNLMVDLRARSAKLADRGVRIVSLVCGLEREPARRLLVAAGGHVKTALAMHMLGESRGLAERALDAVDGFLRVAVDRFAGTGVPYYAAYPAQAGPNGTGTLIAALADSPARLVAAREAARAGGEGLKPVGAASGGWSDASHAAHLLAFEREVVAPRVRAFLESEAPAFDDWEPTDPPPGADRLFEASLELWGGLRRSTLEPLDRADGEVWARTARLGGEELTLHQFLRGVKQHDAAHALRIEERVHPALLDAGSSGDGVTLYAGLMSGTSLDGVDVALVDFTGSDERPESFEVVAFLTVPYDGEIRTRIRRAISAGSASEICALDFLLGRVAAAAMRDVLTRAGVAASEVRALGSHGQTIWHAPPEDGEPGATLQIGSAAVIAEETSIAVVSDLRSRDVAAGGHGAPLTPYADRLLLSGDESRMIQNLGGMGNLTFLPARGAPGSPVAFDTGPGVALLDAAVERLTGGARAFDADGRLAASGDVDADALAEWLSDPWFEAPPPKSTGRERFSEERLDRWLATHPSLSPEDAACTLTRLTARSIADSLRWLDERPEACYLAGGGGRNPELARQIAGVLDPIPVRDLAELGLDPDAREAVAFALLARQHVLGVPAGAPWATGASGPRVLGSWTPA